MEKRTKIVCTIGPATWDPKVLKRLVASGMSVARINCAFADVAELDRVGKLVRSVSTDVALMLDIKGNNVRLNRFAEPVKLSKGKEFIIGSSVDDYIYPKNHLTLYKDLKEGANIIFDGGKVRAKVSKIANKKIYCRVVQGTVLNPGKSVNTPGTFLSIPAVTKFDIELINFAVKDNWDFIAASYIRSVEDVKEVRKYCKNSKIQIIAKIEEEIGVNNYDEILKVADGIMIGRGDMGVEMPFEKIPAIQKMMIQLANFNAKPIITATNVMESMAENPYPTRAEISDAANAIFDGTDAIMTSIETSTGAFPVETVHAINLIASENEQYVVPDIIDSVNLDVHKVAVAMANAVFELCNQLEVTKVLLFTSGGITARVLARYNLDLPIVAFTDSDTVKRQLNLTKGITPITFAKKFSSRNAAVVGTLKYCLDNKILNKSDKVVVMGKAYITSAVMNNIFEYIELDKFKELI